MANLQKKFEVAMYLTDGDSIAVIIKIRKEVKRLSISKKEYTTWLAGKDPSFENLHEYLSTNSKITL